MKQLEKLTICQAIKSASKLEWIVNTNILENYVPLTSKIKDVYTLSP